MKIATWNINGFRACFNKGLLDFIKNNSLDILCLQETKVHPDQLLENQRGLFPYEEWSSCGIKKGYSGTAIFSQQPAFRILKGMGIKKYDWEGRLLVFEGKNFVLVNIYFPNGSMTLKRHVFKQEFLSKLPFFLWKLKKETDKELIVVGDYNIAYQEIDVHSPKQLRKTSGFLPEERQWFELFLKKGYIDVYRYFYPDQKEAYTWWSLRERARLNNRGWRIDHICVTEALKSKLKSIEICSKQLGSDHCPLIMDIDL